MDHSIWWLLALSVIPSSWWSINRCRAWASKWWSKRNCVVNREPPSETETWCAGCDELRPISWMAFVDEDNDGMPDAKYLCRVCHNEPPRQIGVDAAGMPEIDHYSDCQCINCMPHWSQRNLGQREQEAVKHFLADNYKRSKDTA